jgi:hypothetical protein
MKISIQQLDAVVSKMKYGLLGYSSAEKQDLEVTIEFVTADPGLGRMVDCVKLTAYAPVKEGDDKETSMVIEMYPYGDKEAPRASKIESFKIEGKY